jgi:ribosomal protein S18 acetylase RimI-like enzyme
VSPRIERLNAPASEADIRGLAHLLRDAVDSGAAASFLAPLTQEMAEAWWRDTIASSGPRAVFLVVREETAAGTPSVSDDGAIVGTVQLQPSWAPNQPHRGDIAKLLVHRRARRHGLGARLMQAIEEEARRGGFGQLVLDTRRGDNAERLYRRLGWTVVGTIPRYAYDPDGAALHDTVVFYKEFTSRAPEGAPVPDFVVTADPAPEDVQYLEDRLGEFNAAATGFTDGAWLAIFVRDRDGRIVAGLCGSTFGGAADIRQFWVDEPLRNQGWGTKLLDAAEQEARRRGCRQITLMTFDFQAPDFYARHGFEVVAALPDHPIGHRNFLLRKQW